MRIMTGVATLAVLAGLAAAPAQAETTTRAVDALRTGTLPTTYTQFRGQGGWHRGGWNGWRGGNGYRRGPGVGAAVGAGLLGFAAGAVIGSAAANAAARRWRSTGRPHRSTPDRSRSAGPATAPTGMPRTIRLPAPISTMTASAIPVRKTPD